MNAEERDEAFNDGFVLATTRWSYKTQHIVETGQRLMQIVSLIQICVDTVGEEEGISLAKSVADNYAGR